MITSNFTNTSQELFRLILSFSVINIIILIIASCTLSDSVIINNKVSVRFDVHSLISFIVNFQRGLLHNILTLLSFLEASDFPEDVQIDWTI